MNRYRATILAGIGFYANGEPISALDAGNAIEKIRAYAASKFGGVTIREHDGSWHDGVNTITESGITIETLINDPFADNLEVSANHRLREVDRQARAFATYVKSVLQQNSVVLIVDIPSVVDFV